jgi:copper chaperone CopZ
MTKPASVRRKAQAILSLINLGCISRPNAVERKLKKFQGVQQVAVDYVTDTVLVDFDPEVITTDAIRTYMMKLGQNN